MIPTAAAAAVESSRLFRLTKGQGERVPRLTDLSQSCSWGDMVAAPFYDEQDPQKQPIDPFISIVVADFCSASDRLLVPK